MWQCGSSVELELRAHCKALEGQYSDYDGFTANWVLESRNDAAMHNLAPTFGVGIGNTGRSIDGIGR